ncbi:MAG: VanZ family protein [Faecousia sp.]
MAKRKGQFLLAVLTCLVLCFIWGNSMLTGEESGAISGGLLSWLIRTFPFLKWLPELLLRKFGHFSEFGLLGFLLAWFFLLQGQRGLHRLTVPVLFGMTAALTDETIQSFSSGRNPSVMDVWIDVGGACAGIALLYGGYYLYSLIHKRKGTKNEKNS